MIVVPSRHLFAEGNRGKTEIDIVIRVFGCFLLSNLANCLTTNYCIKYYLTTEAEIVLVAAVVQPH